MTVPRPVVRQALGALASSAALVVLAAAPASGHVTANPPEAPAGGYRTVELSVPHGCDGEPTEELTVQLSEEMQSVKAEAVPGWEVTYVREALDQPLESHGTTITEYVSTITWTSTGEPLADDQYMTFGISARWPDAVGEEVLLPAVQRCPSGAESAWIDPDAEADHPAPRVVIAEGEEHGAANGEDVPTVDDGGESADAGDSSSRDGTAIAALVVGVAALATAGYAAVAARRG